MMVRYLEKQRKQQQDHQKRREKFAIALDLADKRLIVMIAAL